MRDISNRDDIEKLVNAFYKKVIDDDLIGIFFTKIVELKWDVHLPVMYDFWESMLFGTGKYKGNPMIKHIEIHKKKRMEAEHFDRWLEVWKSTVRQNFSGEKADMAVMKAEQVSSLMKFKLNASPSDLLGQTTK